MWMERQKDFGHLLLLELTCKKLKRSGWRSQTKHLLMRNTQLSLLTQISVQIDTMKVPILQYYQDYQQPQFLKSCHNMSQRCVFFYWFSHIHDSHVGPQAMLDPWLSCLSGIAFSFLPKALRYLAQAKGWIVLEVYFGSNAKHTSCDSRLSFDCKNQMGQSLWYESLGSNTSLWRQEAGRDAPEGVGPAMHTAFWVRVKAMEKDARGAQKSMDHRRIIENTFDKDKADKALDWWFLYWFVWGDSDFPWFSMIFRTFFTWILTPNHFGLSRSHREKLCRIRRFV